MFARASWRKLGSSGIQYPARKLAFTNMRDYVRVQPEGTMEFNFLTLDEGSASWKSLEKHRGLNPAVASPGRGDSLE